jgi:hypothetical protein
MKAESRPEWWDEWWQQQPYKRFCPMFFFRVEGLAEAGIATVLFAGNGCSQEPRLFEHAGSRVDALDISPLATRMAEEYPVNTDAEQIARLRATPGRPGGQLTLVVGAIEDPTVCPGPYDLIISRLCLQYYSGDELVTMCKALKSRMHSRGLVVVQTHNAGKAAGEIEMVFLELGVPTRVHCNRKRTGPS